MAMLAALMLATVDVVPDDWVLPLLPLLPLLLLLLLLHAAAPSAIANAPASARRTRKRLGLDSKLRLLPCELHHPTSAMPIRVI
jgi:hypothetical protein